MVGDGHCVVVAVICWRGAFHFINLVRKANVRQKLLVRSGYIAVNLWKRDNYHFWRKVGETYVVPVYSCEKS